MLNSKLKVNQKIKMPGGEVFLILKKTKFQIYIQNVLTKKIHCQGLKNKFYGEIITVDSQQVTF